MAHKFTVTWTVIIEADTALHAAMKARALQQNPDNGATVYAVQRSPSNAVEGSGSAKPITWVDQIDLSVFPMRNEPVSIEAVLELMRSRPSKRSSS